MLTNGKFINKKNRLGIYPNFEFIIIYPIIIRKEVTVTVKAFCEFS